MEKIRLGRTELYVTKTAFGALPIQRISKADAVKLVRRAYESGIIYFDTANMYTDSEEKLGEALHDVRTNIVISTKSAATDKKTALSHMEQSLRSLRTDYIDLIQFHNPAKLPDINDPDGAFAAALEMRKKGYVRHIGITNHRLGVAREAIASGDFETLQFPFCYLTTDKELSLVEDCRQADMGFIAMKGLAGGLISNSRAAFSYMSQFDHVLPIWGIQRMTELDEWLSYMDNPPAMDDDIRRFIEAEKEELTGDFCRGCGYCMPCPQGIEINQCARMSLMLRRMPAADYLTEYWQGAAVPSQAFAEGGIHEAIIEYENNVFFDILAEDLARRDMDDVPIDETNYDELTQRIDAYIDEFEAHGTDNITVDC